MWTDTILALVSLRRRGFSVVAILVVMEDAEREKAQVLLEGHGIPTRHFKDRKELRRVCTRSLVSGP